MGYRVKWVEEHLGVSRKALRLFEKFGLMPANEDSQYRDYSEDDIDRIWTIRVMQGIGFTLREIVSMASDPDFDFNKALCEKVDELEIRKNDAERHLGYAKMIKVTGRYPSRPKELGTIRWDEFQRKALDDWNVHSDPQVETTTEMVEKYLSDMTDRISDSKYDLGLEYLAKLNLEPQHIQVLMTTFSLLQSIARRTSLGPDHPEIQLLVKIIFDEARNCVEVMADATPEQFGRIASSGFVVGDISVILQDTFGKEICLFIADAIAIFGGYKNYEDID